MALADFSLILSQVSHLACKWKKRRFYNRKHLPRYNTDQEVWDKLWTDRQTKCQFVYFLAGFNQTFFVCDPCRNSYSIQKSEGQFAELFQLTMDFISRAPPSSDLYRPIFLLFSTYSWIWQESVMYQLFIQFQKRCFCSWISEQPQNTSCFLKHQPLRGRNTVTIFTLCILISHHQGLVHVVLVPWAAIIILCVHGEAEEEDIHHILKDRQEAVSHQEREHTHDE